MPDVDLSCYFGVVFPKLKMALHDDDNLARPNGFFSKENICAS